MTSAAAAAAADAADVAKVVSAAGSAQATAARIKTAQNKPNLMMVLAVSCKVYLNFFTFQHLLYSIARFRLYRVHVLACVCVHVLTDADSVEVDEVEVEPEEEEKYLSYKRANCFNFIFLL